MFWDSCIMFRDIMAKEVPVVQKVPYYYVVNLTLYIPLMRHFVTNLTVSQS
jgi:hypothetical protein